MLCANQDLNSVGSTRKVSLNKLNDPPEMQQVVMDKAGTRFTFHLSYANRRISVPTEVGTRERERADGAPARKRDKSRPLYPK
jgi:serine/threonine protein kinase HipA of HipAB toxin-antitoxin module